MFSKNMRETYNRFLILGLLSMCLFVFGFSDKIETAHAAVCQQDCDKYNEICEDSCQDECSATGQRHSACNTCVTNCSVEWNSCSEHSIYCTSGTVSYDPECQVNFGIHCLVTPGGIEDCSLTGGAHNGYFMTCNRIGYENGCIVCPNPDDENCHGGGEEPPQCL